VKLFFCILLGALPAVTAPARPVQDISTSAGTVKITPINHATLMLEGGGKVILVDPTSAGNYEGLPPADIILITDIHGDHMDPKALPKVQKDGTVIFAPEAVAKSVRALGKDARAFEGADAIADYVAAEAKSGDLLLVMSNGSFDGLCDKLLKKLGAEVPVEANRR